MPIIRFRRGTSAQAAASPVVLASGEPAVETDTRKLRIGDGVTPTASLPAYLDETGVTASYARVATPEKFGAIGDGVADDTAALQAAVDSLDDTLGGLVAIGYGKIYKFTALNVTTPRVRIEGPGTLRNGTIYVGVQSGYAPVELWTRISVAFDRTSKSTTVDAISVANTRHVDVHNCSVTGYRALVSFPALALGGTNDQHSARISIIGCRTPYWWDSSGAGTAPLDYLVYVAQNLSGGSFGVGDVAVANNPAITARISHIYGFGLDGLKCSGNTFFFAGYQRSNPDKMRHIDLTTTDWLNITGNQFFESGYESIRITDPRNISITGNNIAWSGQRDLKDAIALVLSDSAKYVRGGVTGNNISLFSGAALAIYGASGGDASGLSISGNTTLATNPYPQYYGVPTLPSTFSRYKADAALTGLPRIPDPVSLLGQATTDQIGTTSSETVMRLGLRSSLMSRGKVVSVTGANTNVATVSNASGSTAHYSGLVSIAAYDSGATHAAHYLVSVGGSATARTLTTVAADGEITGASAVAPSFTWTLNASNQLLATPVGSTSGSFTFYLTSLGNLRAA